MSTRIRNQAEDTVEDELFKEFQDYLGLIAKQYEVRVKEAISNNAALLERMHKKNAEDLNALNVKHEKAIQEISGRIQEYAKMHFEMSSDAYETNKARMEKLTKDNKLALEGMKNLFQVTTNDYMKRNSEIYDSGKKSVEVLCSKMERTSGEVFRGLEKAVAEYAKQSTNILAEHKNAVKQSINTVIKEVDDLKQVVECHRSSSIKYTVILAILSFASIGLSIGILSQLK